jgi:hypothetical protein
VAQPRGTLTNARARDRRPVLFRLNRTAAMRPARDGGRQTHSHEVPVKLTDHVVQFFGLVAAGQVEIYNEFSLQHEFGIYLRSNVPVYLKVQFERPVGFFRLKSLPYIKNEVDIALFPKDQGYKFAVELKFPRNGNIQSRCLRQARTSDFRTVSPRRIRWEYFRDCP